MNTQNTNSGPKTPARRTGQPVAAGQWWKAWVLLTGLGATVFGWRALPRNEQPPASGVVSSPMSADSSPLVRAERGDRPGRVSTIARTVPEMPARPVFEAPVTRTRRS